MKTNKLDQPVDVSAVEYAYAYLLDRVPESHSVVDHYINLDISIRELRDIIFSSEEFKDYTFYRIMDKWVEKTSKVKTTASDCSHPLLLLGTCAAESLARNLPTVRADHLLYQSNRFEKPVITDVSAYNGVMVSLTLRSILGQVAQKVYGVWDELLIFRDVSTQNILGYSCEIIDELLSNISGSIESVPIFILSFVEPFPTESGVFHARSSRGLYRIVRELNDYLSEKCNGEQNLWFCELNDLLRRHGDWNFYDGYWEYFSHSGLRSVAHPFFFSLYQRISVMLDSLDKDKHQPVKAIITDLDNTLWKGVLAEMDEVVPGDHTEGWPIGYAEALLTCKRRGIVLAICSKNDDAQTRVNFDKVWYGRLRLDDFASIRINWRPKSENIREILAELNILPEHALFIDDNPLEIAEVQRAFPQMRTLSGDPHRWRMELIYGVPTQVPRLSEEAARRTELLQAKVQREQMAATATDREGYLRDLQLRAEIRSITVDDKSFDRALELINRTNQFNTTGQRWTAAELRQFQEAGGRLWILRAADRFAEHGIVGVALLQSGRLRQMVLSCRVFGLGLEDTFLAQIVAENPSPEALRADWQDTGRNATARQFLERYFAPGEDYLLHTAPEWPSHIVGWG
ncbi:MAG: HAD-IIIC family phosphatase [Acidithiobacillus sp.]|nr:HAD-IIIC family phosphatase [Acidithiobacillus sp.]